MTVHQWRRIFCAAAAAFYTNTEKKVVLVIGSCIPKVLSVVWLFGVLPHLAQPSARSTSGLFVTVIPSEPPPEAGMNEAIHIWNPSSLGKETGHWLHRNHMNISGHWRYTNCLLEPTYLVSASQDEGQPCVFFQTHGLSLTSPAVLSNSLSCFYISLCFALVYNILKVTQTKVVLY